MVQKRRKVSNIEAKKLPNINNLEEADTALIDFDKLVKHEYQRLLRQYRLMEDERHTVAAKGKALSKQARLLDLLFAEVRDINTDLYNVDCDRNKAADGVTRRTILEILESFDKAKEEQEFCLKNIRELSDHVSRIIRYLIEHNLKVQAIYGNSRTPAQVEKRRRILENRLYFYTTRYCLKIHANKLIRRDEINLSLKLRGLFYTRHTSLKQQLQEIRARMGEVVFLATQAYDQRDELVATSKAIRERNDKDNRQHVLEMKEFNRIIHHDAMVRSFLQRKVCSRNINETEKQRATRKNQNKLNSLNHQLTLYARSFNTILQKASFDSMETLIRSYNEKMQQNFAIFRSNCDLNNEIVFLRAETLELSKAVEEQHKIANEAELQHESSIGEAIQRKALIDLDLKRLQGEVTTAEMTMGEIVKIINTLFKMVGCSQKSLTAFLGTLAEVKPANAVFAMNLIDSRVQELVQQKNQLETRRNFEVLNSGPKERRNTIEEAGPKGKSAGGPFIPNVVVATHMEENDDEDEDHTTLTPIPVADLRLLILERIRLKKEVRGSFRFSVQASSPSRLSQVQDPRQSMMGPGSGAALEPPAARRSTGPSPTPSATKQKI